MQPNNTTVIVEIASIFGPMFLIIFGGIIAIYTRITKMETRLEFMEPMWNDWIARRDTSNL